MEEGIKLSINRLVVLLVPAASCVFQQKNNLTTTDISYRLRMFKTIGYHTHLVRSRTGTFSGSIS